MLSFQRKYSFQGSQDPKSEYSKEKLTICMYIVDGVVWTQGY